jgi:endonuclease/exonuclease/phosphatase family metal-dependent hydrolase
MGQDQPAEGRSIWDSREAFHGHEDKTHEIAVLLERGTTMSQRRTCLAALGLLLVGVGWVLAASRPGQRVEGCPEGCAAAETRREGPLRVLSFNVLHDFPRFRHLTARLAHIAAAIRELDPDVICLQEVPWRWGSAAQRLAEELGLNYVYARANGNRWAILFEEGEAILSRYPLRESDCLELEPRADFFQRRVVLRATADTPWGPLRLFATHLTHDNPAANRGQAASLAEFVARSGGGPAVVAGDFNAEEEAPQIQALGWVDTYRRVHPDDPGYTCCVDDLTGGPDQVLTKRIDYLFFVPGASQGDTSANRARVVSSRRVLDGPFRTAGGWLWPSDHVGVLSEIELGP